MQSIYYKEKTMREIAVCVENAVQYYSVEPLLKAMDEVSIEYDIILPNWDTPTLRRDGWTAIEEGLEEVLKQRCIPFIKAPVDNVYRISMSPYPMRWVKSVFKVAYSYAYVTKAGYSAAPENKLYYDVILCHGDADAEFFSAYARTCIIGEPKLLGYKKTAVQHKKPKLLYLPTYSELSSINDAVPELKKLSNKYEIIAKAHHGTSYLTNETEHRDILLRTFTKVYDAKTPLYDLLAEIDVVLSDNSGAICDAIAAGVPVARFSTVKLKTIDGFVPFYLEFVENGVLPSTDNPEKIESVLETAMTKEVRDLQARAARALYFDPEEGKRNFIVLMDELLYAHEKTRFFSLQCAKNKYHEDAKRNLDKVNEKCNRLSTEYEKLTLEHGKISLENEKLTAECDRINLENEKLAAECDRINSENEKLVETIEYIRMLILKVNDTASYKMFCLLKKFFKLFLLGNVKEKRYFLSLCKACVMGEGTRAFTRNDEYNAIMNITNFLPEQRK